MLMGFIEGLAITINGCILYEYNVEGYIDNDIVSLGVVIFSGVVLTVNVKILARANIIDFFLVIFIIFGVGMLYLTIYLNSLTQNDFLKEIFDRIPLLDSFLRQSNIMGCNEYIITKEKYFFYFLFMVFFICFLVITFNRINFSYVKNICGKEKNFFFKTNKFLIDGINEGAFDVNDGVKLDNINNIDNIDDDCQLLKKNNNLKKNEISTSLNDEDEITI